MSNIGIFGGTFNPVHNGHIRLLKEAVSAAGLDRVIVMPDRIPPHKDALQLAAAEDRLAMCKIAFGDIACAEVSDWELRRSGKSYTVYTVEHIHKKYPDDRLWLIMGSDMLLCFDRWKRWEDILRLADIVCLSRSGNDTLSRLSCQARRLESATGARILVAQAPPFDVSSSQLRDMIKKKLDTSCYFPEKIVQYICEHKLYE